MSETFTKLIGDAEAAIAKGTAPPLSAREYEDLMVSLAAAEKRAGETTGAALSRLMADADDRVASCARAAYLAEAAERRAAGSDDALEKRARRQELAYDLMRKRAQDCRREGETFDQAFDRLAEEGDDYFARAYAVYCEA
jgi:hypothetical protein